jgi:hypothetical protein
LSETLFYKGNRGAREESGHHPARTVYGPARALVSSAHGLCDEPPDSNDERAAGDDEKEVEGWSLVLE